MRGAKLQFASYPFDWLWGSDFIGRCKIIASKFKRFIDKKDLEDTHQTNLDKDNLCEIYHNKYNDLNFNHDFLLEHKFDDFYPIVNDKYARRISRLVNSIEKSRRVLVVCIETPVKDHAVVDDEVLVRGRDIIAKAFPNTEIDLLYFSHSDKNSKIINVSENITRIYDDYKDKKSELDYVVLGDVLIKHLKSFSLNIPLRIKIKRELRRLIINAIPIGKIRHILQRKYHVK